MTEPPHREAMKLRTSIIAAGAAVVLGTTGALRAPGRGQRAQRHDTR